MKCYRWNRFVKECGFIGSRIPRSMSMVPLDHRLITQASQFWTKSGRYGPDLPASMRPRMTFLQNPSQVFRRERNILQWTRATPGGTRTRNPQLRRLVPYTLGHRSSYVTQTSSFQISSEHFREMAMVYLTVLLLCIICRYQPAFYRNSVTTFWTLLGHLVLIVFKVNRHFSASLNHFICSWKIPHFLPVTGLQISGWNCIKFKIILHRIISVVWSTSFSPETWTLTRDDEEPRRLALSV